MSILTLLNVNAKVGHKVNHVGLVMDFPDA
jgi:hypothetical protein